MHGRLHTMRGHIDDMEHLGGVVSSSISLASVGFHQTRYHTQQCGLQIYNVESCSIDSMTFAHFFAKYVICALVCTMCTTSTHPLRMLSTTLQSL